MYSRGAAVGGVSSVSKAACSASGGAVHTLLPLPGMPLLEFPFRCDTGRFRRRRQGYAAFGRKKGKHQQLLSTSEYMVHAFEPVHRALNFRLEPKPTHKTYTHSQRSHASMQTMA